MDIRDSNPRIKNNPEAREFFTTPRNQDSTGWCYAFVASDLISAEIGTPVSTTHLSLMFNKQTESSYFARRSELKRRETARKSFETVYEGGDQADALKLAIKNKYICPERLLPYDVEKPKETYEFIKRIEEIKRTRESNDQNLVCNELNSFVPGLSNLTEISEQILTQNLNLSLEAMAQQRCQGQMVEVPKFNIVMKNRPSSSGALKAYMNQINTVLNNGRPISISYNTRPFFEKSQGGDHASSVVGRRWKNGRCEYKVRNSFGRGCASYKAEFECNENEGAFWIPDSSFESHIDDITYIAP